MFRNNMETYKTMPIRFVSVLSADGRWVCHRPLEKQSHITGRGGPQELQQNTSIPRVFVLGALVPAMLLATWWVRTPFDDGRGFRPLLLLLQLGVLSH